MSDIVERLRGAASKDYGCQCVKCEAADEIERLRAELAAAIKQRDEARRWLRDACAEIARIETRFYDALTPQQIAERNNWNCFGEKQGGGA